LRNLDKSFGKKVTGSLFKLILLCIFPGICNITITNAQSQKPKLDISEVIIEASAPLLAGGKKDPVKILENQASSAFISDTVHRLAIAAPDLIPAPDQPAMEPAGGCLAPFLGLGGSIRGRMVKASKAWEAMRWQTVIDNLVPVATYKKEIPEKPDAYYFIGRCKHYLSDISGAANAYEQLRLKYPENPLCEHALYALGWIYLENGNSEKALEALDQLNQAFPVSALAPYIRYLKAAIYNKENRYADALENLEGIIAGYPLFSRMDDVQFWIGENHFFLGNYKSAERNYSLYLSNYKDGDKRFESLYGRAFANLEQSNYQAALEDFETLLKNETEDTHGAAFHAGKLAIFLGDPAKATSFFYKAIENTKADDVRKTEALAWISYEKKNYQKAIELFESAAHKYPALDSNGKMDPHRSEMLFLAALSCFRNQKYAAAADKFETLASSSSSTVSVAALANAGVAWLKLQRLDLAQKYLQEALSKETVLRGRTLYMLYSAEVLFRLQQFDESINMFRSLEKKDDAKQYQLEVVRGIAWNYYAKENWEKAVEYFGIMADRFPDTEYHAEALLHRAESLFNNGDYDRAKIGFNSLIVEYPLHPEAFEARLLNARADWVRGAYESGMNSLKEALRFAPDADSRQKVRMTMGELFQEQEQYSKAINEYHQAYIEAPQGEFAAAALLKQADNVYNLGQYEESAAIYRTIIQQFPDSEQAEKAQYSIGLTYFHQNRLEDYLNECYQTAEVHPGSQQSSLALSGAVSILTEQNRIKEAVAIQQKLLSNYLTYIDEQFVRLRLANNLILLNQQEQAREMLNELIALAPMGRFAADAMINLAQLAINRNELQKASELYQNVIDDFRYHPRRREAIQRAGDLMIQRQLWSEAESLYRLLSEENPKTQIAFNAFLALAKINLQLDQLGKAEEYTESALKSTDRETISATRLVVGRIHEKQGDRDKALKDYLKIGYLFPDQVNVVIDSLVYAASILKSQDKITQMNRVLAKAEQKSDTEVRRERLRKLRHELGLSGGI